MAHVKPVLTLQVLIQLVETLRHGEPSTTRRRLLETLHFSLQKMLEIEQERRPS